MWRGLGAFLCGLLLATPAFCQPIPQAPARTDQEIRTLLADRVDIYRRSVGMVVGIIDPAGRRVFTHGKYADGDARQLDGDTLFEIGSITKVFTALLLADMVRRGEVALDTPVAKYFPPGAKALERGGRQITFVDLATHTSALPRLPTNFEPKNPANPYADYSVQQLNEFLATHALRRDIGAQYEYSNLGVGLLGLALARQAGAVDYETIIGSRVIQPLAMASTRITLSADLRARLAPGHDAALAPASNWDLPTFAGAGALRSSANDLLIFLAANLGLAETPLAPAMADMLKVRRPIGMPDREIALGWHTWKRSGTEIVWHNGQTGGYSSFAGYDAKARVGVVVLCNASIDNGDIGLHLIDPSIRLQRQRKQVPADARVLEGYVGRYQLAPEFVLTVTREGSRLFVQATGQARFEVFAEAEREFFYRVVDAQITFETDSQGRAMRLILHQNGRDMPAKRIE
jgi:CubicO group peptidase (beta-lactamase class C family)